MIRFLRGSNSRNDRLEASNISEQWVIEGLGGNDTLIGGSSRDTLDGGTGVDLLEGGRGDDRYRVDNSNDRIIEKSGFRTGRDYVLTTASSYTLPDNVEILDIGEDTTHKIVFAAGNSSSNELYGSDTAQKDILDGRAGNDTLVGFGNNDALFGGLGDDVLDGGDGDDTLQGAYTFSTSELEIDFLTGGKGSDRFDLGHSGKKFYANGSLDFAIITDFSSQEDKLVLNGERDNYVINAGSQGASIYLDVDSNGTFNSADDLIADFNGHSFSSLNAILNDSSITTFL